MGGGMMRMAIGLQVAQWALLFGLGALVIVLYRQLGRTVRQPGRQSARGPAAGSTARAIRYYRLPSRTPALFTPGTGQPVLLAFVDPTCPACEQLVSSLSTLSAAGELPGVRILLLISDPPGYLEISAAFRATSLEIGRPITIAEVEGYRVSGTPLLVAIDAAGTVRAAGVASTLDEVQALATAIARESDAA
jgi:hypothetical protein